MAEVRSRLLGRCSAGIALRNHFFWEQAENIFAQRVFRLLTLSDHAAYARRAASYHQPCCTGR
jgi:hypothetical protein